MLACDQARGDFSASAADAQEVLHGELDGDPVGRRHLVDPLFLAEDRIAVVVDPGLAFVAVVVLMIMIAVVVAVERDINSARRQHER